MVKTATNLIMNVRISVRSIAICYYRQRGVCRCFDGYPRTSYHNYAV